MWSVRRRGESHRCCHSLHHVSSAFLLKFMLKSFLCSSCACGLFTFWWLPVCCSGCTGATCLLHSKPWESSCRPAVSWVWQSPFVSLAHGLEFSSRAIFY